MGLRGLPCADVFGALDSCDDALQIASLASDHREERARQAAGVSERDVIPSRDKIADSMFELLHESEHAARRPHRLTQRMSIRRTGRGQASLPVSVASPGPVSASLVPAR